MVVNDINGKQRECVKAYPDKAYPGFIKVEYKNERRSYNEWYPVDEFLAKNPDFNNSAKEIKHEPSEVAGIVTSVTDITLTDKTQKWEKNTYTGFPVWISRGKGEGEVRNVLSNTKDTLVIDKEWDTKPNKYSQYVLSRNIHEQMPALGNILSQERQHEYEIKIKKMERDRKRVQKLIELDENSN